MVGGCCGTDLRHVAANSDTLAGTIRCAAATDRDAGPTEARGRPGSSLMAIEPNAAMQARPGRRAMEADCDIEIVTRSASAIPLPDHSGDDVVGSLVLCTVDDPTTVLAEVRRILRPGGTFRFVEHVAARPTSPRRWLQEAIAPAWRWLFEGCESCRDTTTVLRRAGFDDLHLERRRSRRSGFVPVSSAICGIGVL